MDLVNSLSAEIPEVQSYREKKKNKLKRTFVSASDAAATRAKGFKVSSSRKIQDFLPAASINEPPEDDDGIKVSISSSETQKVLPSGSTYEPSESAVANQLKHVVILENKFLDISLKNKFPIDTVESSFRRSGFTTNNLYHFTKLSKTGFKCDVIWKGNFVCSVNSEKSEMEAKGLASQELLKIMKNHCYTIETLKRIESSTTVETSVTLASNEVLVDEPVPEENKGSKMLRLMGWSGGGLGKDGQGIADPINAVASVNRSGLGLQKLSMKQCLNKILKYLDQFIADESAYDLEFASDFTREERKEIHMFAGRHRMLKTKSHGKGSERRLVVSKVERPLQTVARLIKAGGSTKKHNLVWPLLYPKP